MSKMQYLLRSVHAIVSIVVIPYLIYILIIVCISFDPRYHQRCTNADPNSTNLEEIGYGQSMSNLLLEF